MLFVIPQLISEEDFLYFNEETYAALLPLLDDVLCKYLSDYMSNPEANQQVVDAIDKHYHSIIESYTLPAKLEEMGVFSLVATITPQAVVNLDIDRNEVIEKLSFLDKHCAKTISSVQPRTAANYHIFEQELEKVAMRKPFVNENPNMLQMVKSNSFIFYMSHEKLRKTGMGLVNSRRRSWIVSLRGAEFLNYCESKNIPVNVRRLF